MPTSTDWHAMPVHMISVALSLFSTLIALARLGKSVSDPQKARTPKEPHPLVTAPSFSSQGISSNGHSPIYPSNTQLLSSPSFFPSPGLTFLKVDPGGLLSTSFFGFSGAGSGSGSLMVLVPSSQNSTSPSSPRVPLLTIIPFSFNKSSTVTLRSPKSLRWSLMTCRLRQFGHEINTDPWW